MTIHRLEKTAIPQTPEGVKFANEYEERLKNQGVFGGRKEDTVNIIIDAEYTLVIRDGEME